MPHSGKRNDNKATYNVEYIIHGYKISHLCRKPAGKRKFGDSGMKGFVDFLCNLGTR